MSFSYYETIVSTDIALHPKFVFPEYRHSHMSFHPRDEILSAKWVTMIHELGIQLPDHIQIFFKPQYFVNNDAHVDTAKLDGKIRVYAFNWVIGGRDSLMKWFKPTEEMKPVRKETNLGTGYISYPNHNFDLPVIDSVKIAGDRLTLVNTGIPHAIFNGPEPRYCVSIRPMMPKFMSWEETVAGFQHIIIQRK